MAGLGRPQDSPHGIAGTWPTGGAPQAAGFAPAGLGAWSWLAGTLREWAKAEAGAGRLLPWLPVAFGSGIALYFSADHEPVLAVAAITAIVLGVAAFLFGGKGCLRRP